ncbi:MAG: 16S rRNA (cytidine(1402)-2'-O)-methyltransferase [Flavobacteriales bacterium]|nr:16S rRNA (cytidine(1402)-2'-O)-methyltransferase [Flavobacteriales bacterium]|tara:strand:+ start:65 stop:739 length:675 start_codon:yes stop_codon:yes gene_type:complete
MSKLILIPTPIGNLEDITLRAIETIKKVDFLLAEDTRHTGKLLKHLNIEKKMWSYHAHNEHKSILPIIDKIKSGELVGLVSDAGTPGVSDPGFLLIRECIKAGVDIETLPGPTALIPALVGSGLPCDKFYFEGFLPHKKGRQSRLKFLATLPCTIIFYESPHRLLKTLKQIEEFIGGNRQSCIVRELTKVYETFHRGLITDQIILFEKHPPKGEIVLVLEGLLI